MKSIHKILFLRLDHKIGDTVVETFFIRELKKLYPKAHLTVVTTAPKELLCNNPYINTLEILHIGSKGWIYAISRLYSWRKEKYDLLIADDLSLKRKFLLYCIHAKQVISANRFPQKHITYRFVDILRQLGAKNINDSYELFISDPDKQQAVQFMQKNGLTAHKFLIFNPTGAASYRTLSISQINKVLILLHCLKPSWPIVLLDYKNQYTQLNNLVYRYTNNRIMPTAALIQYAEYILTVDTGIVHIADIFKKKMTVLFSLLPYSTEQAQKTHIVHWGPKTTSAKILTSQKTVDTIPAEDIVNTVLKGLAQ